MVLLPVGAMLGKALIDKMSRNGSQQVARSSRMMSNLSAKENWKPRPRTRAFNPFSKDEVLNRIGGTGIRRLATSSPNVVPEKEAPSEITDWVAVYRYPNIRYCQLLARAKFIQTLASMAYLPYSTYQYSIEAITSTWFYSTAALAVVAPIALAVFSRYINRLVGVIAMSEDNDWVRIGYLTFWGRRKNKLLQLEDIMLLSEMGVNEKDRLVKVGWYSGNGDFVFLPTDGCEILDEERAKLLFGSTQVFDKKPKTE